MKKFGHLPESVAPLEVVAQQVAGSLQHVFARNGHEDVVFTLSIMNMNTHDLVCVGNLKAQGAIALMEGAIERYRNQPKENPDAGKD